MKIFVITFCVAAALTLVSAAPFNTSTSSLIKRGDCEAATGASRDAYNQLLSEIEVYSGPGRTNAQDYSSELMRAYLTHDPSSQEKIENAYNGALSALEKGRPTAYKLEAAVKNMGSKYRAAAAACGK
ncbi:hypothetical protein BGZ98_005750 [Dissophora globulifera]|nr:hypothetical protein BGZ98_005750 [Dissophora globulifera]